MLTREIEAEFITRRIRVAVAATYGVPAMAILFGWFIFTSSTDSPIVDYEQEGRLGAVMIAQTSPAESSPPAAEQQQATSAQVPPVSPAAEPHAAVGERVTQRPSVAASSQAPAARESDRQPTPRAAFPPSDARQSRASAEGTVFPTYRFVTLPNALDAARDLKGLFVLKNGSVAMRLGMELDRGRIHPTPFQDALSSYLSNRMVRLSREDAWIDDFVRSASELCRWPAATSELFLVFPIEVDNQIQQEQRRALARYGLKPDDDVDMTVTYQPGRYSSGRFVVHVVRGPQTNTAELTGGIVPSQPSQ